MPERIQRKRTKGWRMPEGAVYVGRPSDFANPYRLKSTRCGWYVQGNGLTVMGDGQPLTVDQAHEIAVDEFRKLYAPTSVNAYWARVRLKGKDLACWCAPGFACHADVLLEVANA